MVSQKIRQLVFTRADHLCEYCCPPMSHSLDPFNVEHIVPLSKNGTNELDNLACSCGGCNGHKHNKMETLDPVSNLIVPIYHPRLMVWQNHFTWSSNFTELIGISSIGRATIETLRLNRAGIINIRRLLFLDGLHPPKL